MITTWLPACHYLRSKSFGGSLLHYSAFSVYQEAAVDARRRQIMQPWSRLTAGLPSFC